MKYFLGIILLIVSPALAETSESRITVEGVLLERGTKKPIPEANVFVLPVKLKGTSDNQGRFRIEGVPEGEFEIVVNLTGYVRLSKTDTQRANELNPSRTLYLERDSYQVYETTVCGKLDSGDDSTRSLKASVAQKLPGSNGDPIKAVQNLPGVSRAAGFSRHSRRRADRPSPSAASQSAPARCLPLRS